MVGRAEDLLGRRFGMLTVVALADPYIHANGRRVVRWLCDCDCGGESVTRAETLKRGNAKSCGCRGRADKITYSGMHVKLRKERGPASSYTCQQKDCEKPAAEWAYDGADRGEFVGSISASADHPVRAWSGDIYHYMPLCRSHHRLFDREQPTRTIEYRS